MADYPGYALVTLVETSGQSCGNLTQPVKFQDDSDPPEYREIVNQGHFDYCLLRRLVVGGNPTWELTIFNSAQPCGGFWVLRRTVAADDPTGDYCQWLDGQMNCAGAKASVVDDD